MSTWQATLERNHSISAGFLWAQKALRNHQPHLNSQSILWQFQRFRRDAKSLNFTPIKLSLFLRFLHSCVNLQKQKANKNDPICVSGCPVPPHAPRCSGRFLRGLSLRSNSALQTGFSLRSAGRAVTSAHTSGQSDKNRKNPHPMPRVCARWRPGTLTNNNANLCENEGGHWRQWPMVSHPPMGGVSSADLLSVCKYNVRTARNFFFLRH